MNTLGSFNTARAAARRFSTALAACAGLGISMAACATTQPFNPAGLQADDLTRVSGICRDVMGLSPSEPLSGGYWMGSDNLDFWSSHYRGCVTALSGSVVKIADADATRVAESDCHARGLAGPDLSLCVLQEANRRASGPAAAVTVPAAAAPPAPSPFLSASAREERQREELACAALGLDPAGGAFSGCVKDLRTTFFALEHPIT
jgi:hypothetical protein